MYEWESFNGRTLSIAKLLEERGERREERGERKEERGERREERGERREERGERREERGSVVQRLPMLQDV